MLYFFTDELAFWVKKSSDPLLPKRAEDLSSCEGSVDTLSSDAVESNRRGFTFCIVVVDPFVSLSKDLKALGFSLVPFKRESICPIERCKKNKQCNRKEIKKTKRDHEKTFPIFKI